MPAFLFSIALASAALLAGCQSYSAISPGTPSQEVQARFGSPGMIYKNDDGSEAWEYPREVHGPERFMITIGPDRKTREVRQVITEEIFFARIRPGMSREEVRRTLGRPRDISYVEAWDEEVWTWPEQLLSEGSLFHVIFDRPSGKVKRKLQLEDKEKNGDLE
jgi:hypothetical protein